ncbi:MAG: tetratricopeptide repeat protein [Sandaracinaceae bacterium]|nr:tetratricopeptide repeat protein [Sandaracinaceae bacterium]
MDKDAAQLAIGWHLQHAGRLDRTDPEAAKEERLHALALAERFALAREIVDTCGTLCWHEVERFGAPVTPRLLERGLALAPAVGDSAGSFRFFEGLYHRDRGELDRAQECLTAALDGCSDDRASARVLCELGVVLLRAHRFEDARERFTEGLSITAEGHADRLVRLRLFDGCAEAERQLGEDRAARASSLCVLPLTEEDERDESARIYRSRAFNALGLLHWRAGQRAEARRALSSAVEVWSEDERVEAGEAFVAWERLRALQDGCPAPVEGNPGDGTALAFVRLGRDVLVPADLSESPPSRETLARFEAWANETGASEAPLEMSLRSLLSGQVGDRWFVSRVQRLSRERRVLVELVAAGPVS